MAPPFHAIIAGAGSGTGRSAALRFATAYSVVLLSRNPATIAPIVDEVRSRGGTAIGIPADASDPAALDAALRRVAAELPGSRLAAAVYNANAGFAFKPFLEMTELDLDTSLGTGAKGFFFFAQKTLPGLVSTLSSSSPAAPHPPTLIVTGATASVRGSARFSTFAAGKFAQRAIAQSIAREYGPKGVHVALAIIDGGIDTPWGNDRVFNNGVEDGKLSPDSIAESYWNLHTQHRSAWTHELDLRPFVEKW